MEFHVAGKLLLKCLSGANNLTLKENNLPAPVLFVVCLTEIDFEEFLAIYKRIFVLSKSTVGDHVNEITRHPPKLIPSEHSKASLTPSIISAYSLHALLLYVFIMKSYK